MTSRRGAWAALGVAVVGFLVLFGLFAGATAPSGTSAAPKDSESARVSDVLSEFPGADQQSVLLVASRDDGARLTDADIARLQATIPAIDRTTGSSSSDPRVSDDGEAAVISTPITVGASDSKTAEVIKDLRSTIASADLAGLTVQVTGGPAFGADVASSFDGANFTLLAVTIAIVAILLIVTYRSPILWLLPLIVVALADQLASVVTTAVGAALDLQFDGGIISVLVFGAGTNYALLLISRYREELARTASHRAALSAAWRHAAPAIVASNLTVVLALLTLALAVIPGTHGLGIASAVGLLIAVVAMLFVLPPLLAVCGRKVFWPFVPRPDGTMRQGRVWRALATRGMRRPGVSLGAGVLLLAVMATGLIGTSIGLNQIQKFRVQSESAAGLEVLSAHFPSGEAQPIFVVANSAEADAVVGAASGVAGVVAARPVGQTADGSLTKIMVTSGYEPDTDRSLDQITELRTAVHAVPGADALVGGETATELDARQGNDRDLWLVAPLVLAVSFLVLLLLLRSVIAPVLLLLVNISSAVAAVGAGSWLSRVLFDQDALASQLPLLAFLFLVALGIDYTIFLVHRARTETVAHGTREGMVRAVAHTGGVITSAGIVLAGVFAALGVLPLVILGQLGLIVGVGVLVDTLVVRTVIVPAIFGLVGEKIWWPSRPHRSSDSRGKAGGAGSRLEPATENANPTELRPDRVSAGSAGSR